MENLNPGRDLDALIAEKVMGADKIQGHFVKTINPETKVISVATELYYPPYSTRIEDAWQVVEKFTKNGQDVRLQSEKDGTWFRCYITDEKDPFKEHFNIENVWDAPHAICLAALKAVEPRK